MGYYNQLIESTTQPQTTDFWVTTEGEGQSGKENNSSRTEPLPISPQVTIKTPTGLHSAQQQSVSSKLKAAS